MTYQQGPQDPRQWQTQPVYQQDYPQQQQYQPYQQQPYQQPYGPQGYPAMPPPPRKSSNAPLILVIIGVAVLLLVGGCFAVVAFVGSTATPKAVATGAVKPSPGKGEAKEPGTIAEIGETVTVRGLQIGTKVEVTVRKVYDPATAASQFLTPRDGYRYVAIEMTIKNVGGDTFTDSPVIGAELIDTDGQTMQVSVGDVKEGQQFGGAVNIRNGDVRKGVVVFEVPKGAKLDKFQYGTMFGQEKGEWSLR